MDDDLNEHFPSHFLHTLNLNLNISKGNLFACVWDLILMVRKSLANCQIRHKTQESDKVMSQGITDITVSNCRDLKREKTKINSHQVNSWIVVVGGHKFVNACYKSLLEVLYKNSAAKTQPISPSLANCRVYSLRWKLDHSITRGPTDL